MSWRWVGACFFGGFCPSLTWAEGTKGYEESSWSHLHLSRYRPSRHLLPPPSRALLFERSLHARNFSRIVDSAWASSGCFWVVLPSNSIWLPLPLWLPLLLPWGPSGMTRATWRRICATLLRWSSSAGGPFNGSTGLASFLTSKSSCQHIFCLTALCSFCYLFSMLTNRDLNYCF